MPDKKVKVKEDMVIQESLRIGRRTYFSSYHYYAAKHFSGLAKNIEDSHNGRSKFNIIHRSYVTNSILSSIAFLESSINELYQDVMDNHNNYTKNLSEESKNILADYWRMTEGDNKFYINILDKYQLALRFCNRPVFDKGNNPFQSVNLVVKLRNILVHYKPETLFSDEQHKLTDQLQNKFEENKLMNGSGNPFFPDKCLGYGCTKWAFESVEIFANQFFKEIQVFPNYQQIDFSKMET